MAIITGQEIVREVKDGGVHISPFDRECVGPNSYDLHLGDTLLTYTYVNYPWMKPLDVKAKNKTYKKTIHHDGEVLHPGILYLGSTIEEAGSDHYVPIIVGCSSLGRLGLKVHATAGFGDIGYKYQWTLELEVIHPLRIYAGMRICQIYFNTVQGKVSLYNGRYAESTGVVASGSWKDFG